MDQNTRRMDKPLRIAQVAPLYESVPPKLYGGTERIVSYLTEELVRQGHDVTLFASGDSLTAAHLIASWPRSLRLDKECVDGLAPHLLMLEHVYQLADQFDLIHYHCDYLHFPYSRRHKHPQVTTLHGRLNIRELGPLYREFSDMPVVSISNAQRQPLPWANWQGTVYHGLPDGLHTFRPQPGEYLAFLGRISPEKRVDQAIAIARRAGRRLKIAAKVDGADKKYFEREIEPLLRESHSFVEFIGEVGGKEKDDFLGNAYALLFPIDWPEPFGLVMIEAMACGTPVIACRRGSVPEVMDDGVTGFVVDSLQEAVNAVQRVASLRQRNVAKSSTSASARRMAQDYVRIYRRLIEDNASKARTPRAVDGPRSRALAKSQRVPTDADCLGVWPD